MIYTCQATCPAVDKGAGRCTTTDPERAKRAGCCPLGYTPEWELSNVKVSEKK